MSNIKKLGLLSVVMLITSFHIPVNASYMPKKESVKDMVARMEREKVEREGLVGAVKKKKELPKEPPVGKQVKHEAKIKHETKSVQPMPIKKPVVSKKPEVLVKLKDTAEDRLKTLQPVWVDFYWFAKGAKDIRDEAAINAKRVVTSYVDNGGPCPKVLTKSEEVELLEVLRKANCLERYSGLTLVEKDIYSIAKKYIKAGRQARLFDCHIKFIKYVDEGGPRPECPAFVDMLPSLYNGPQKL